MRISDLSLRASEASSQGYLNHSGRNFLSPFFMSLSCVYGSQPFKMSSFVCLIIALEWLDQSSPNLFKKVPRCSEHVLKILKKQNMT